MYGSLAKRVAITGMGVVSPLGNSVSKCWENAVSGHTGIDLLTDESVANLPVKIFGSVKDFCLDEEILASKEQGKLDRFILFALKAASEGLLESEVISHYDPQKIGCILGVGMGGFPFIESTMRTYTERGPRRVSPFFVPSIIPNMAAGMVSLVNNLKGMNYAISSACASGTHAIFNAASEILNGRQDVMLAGGSESVISALPVCGFSNMKALFKGGESDPSSASCPFDEKRAGFVMGEGSAILVLENEIKAKQRNANILGYVVGGAANSDAYHMTAPMPSGEGARDCMEAAIRDAGVSKDAIGYINAHGTSTPLGDLAETNAIKECFGHHAKNLLVSSTKSMTGHLLGAAGALESVFCVKALQTGSIPPTINLHKPGEGLDLNYTALESIEKSIEFAVNNSFGFGGTNGTLVFQKA